MPPQLTDGNIDREVGRLDGRLGALETRMDRHEIETRAQLTIMDGKLDLILNTQANRTGFAAGGKWFIGSAISIAGLILAWVNGWVHLSGVK